MNSKLFKVSVVVLIIAFVCTVEACASFIQEGQALEVVENWLAMNPTPMNSAIGQAIEDIQYYQGEPYGDPGYYVVFLNPNIYALSDESF